MTQFEVAMLEKAAESVIKIEQFEQAQAQAFLEFLKENSTTYDSVKNAIDLCNYNSGRDLSARKKSFMTEVESLLEHEIRSLPVAVPELILPLPDAESFLQKLRHKR